MSDTVVVLVYKSSYCIQMGSQTRFLPLRTSVGFFAYVSHRYHRK